MVSALAALLALQISPVTAKFSDMRLYDLDGLLSVCWTGMPIARSEDEDHQSGVVTVTKKFLVPAPEHAEPFLWIISIDRQDSLDDSFPKLGAADAFKDFVKPDDLKIISTFRRESLADGALKDLVKEFGAPNVSFSVVSMSGLPFGEPTKDPFLNEILPYAPQGSFTGYELVLKKGSKVWQIMTPMAPIYGTGGDESKLAEAQKAFDSNWTLMMSRFSAGARRKQLETDFQKGGPLRRV